jgi:peptidoglycan-associated lipoprotein
MNSARVLNLIVLGLVLVIPFAGCRKKPTPLTPLPGARSGPVPGPAPAPPIVPGEPGVESKPVGFGEPDRDKWANAAENHEIFKAQTVYFDFDSAVVKSSEKAKIETVAAHLKANPSHGLRVEGNCDERGTEEYNRALGARRALAVREVLIADGIAADRLPTISYGEDRPADPGHSEAAWKKNRRDEFVLLTPK